MDQPETTMGLGRVLKGLLWSAGLALGGLAILGLATMTGRVFPFVAVVAVVAVGMVILGGLGLVLVLLSPLILLVGNRFIDPWLDELQRKADEKKEQGPNAWMLQYDADYQLRKRRRQEAEAARAAASQPRPAILSPIPAPPGPAAARAQPVPVASPAHPLTPPGPASGPWDQWSEEKLRLRLAALDGAAKGFRIHQIDVPAAIPCEAGEINAELRRRVAAR